MKVTVRVLFIVFIALIVSAVGAFSYIHTEKTNAEKKNALLKSQYDLLKAAHDRSRSDEVRLEAANSDLLAEMGKLKDSQQAVLGAQTAVTPTPTTTPAITVTPVVSVTPDPELKMGTIEGAISFPGDKIPDYLVVCAENILTYETACTAKHIASNKYTYGQGYKLKVMEGKYNVFAKLVGSESVGYYTEAVKCGMNSNCQDHANAIVSVTPGKNTTNVDPIDWGKSAE